MMTTLLYSISDVELSDIIQFCVAGILVRFSILESKITSGGLSFAAVTTNTNG